MLTFLINRAAWLLSLLVFAAVILSMIAQVSRAPWLRHPLVTSITTAGDAICAPFRQLMRTLGLPTAPLDFSPMVAMIAIGLVRDVLTRVLRGL